MTHAFCESWARFAGSSFFARLEKLPPHTRPALRLLYCFTGLRERSCAWRDSLIPSQFGSGEFMHDANPSTLDLQATAKQIMQQRGFQPDFPPEVSQQVAELKVHPPQVAPAGNIGDLRNLLWASIDNDTSRDLDQIEVAERLPSGDVKVLIGIADVDAFVPKQTPVDQHAARETTTVYAGVCNFPMLPEELSTGNTSLLESQDCLSVVCEFVVDAVGHVTSGVVYRALVRNHAQLQYNAVGAWLEGTATAPPKVASSADLQAQLRLQNEAAQKLKNQRFANGALSLQTDELHALILNDQV